MEIFGPKKVYIDFKFLASLDNSAKKSGIGEMCHYFIYENIKLFKIFMNDYEKILNIKVIKIYL